MATLFRSEAFFGVYLGLEAEYDLPLLLARGGDRSPLTSGAESEMLLDRVQSIEPGVSPLEWLTAYKELLAPLLPDVYQLTVQLAYDDAELRGPTWDHPDWGAIWRQSDLELVKSQAFRDFLRDEGFVLIDLGGTWPGRGQDRTAEAPQRECLWHLSRYGPAPQFAGC